MSAQLEVQQYLNEELSRLQTRNPSYSLRAFAKRLDLNPAALSQILNGKRRISKKMAEKILDNALAEPEDREKILHSFERAKKQVSFEKRKDEKKKAELSADTFHAISKWYHFAILSLTNTNNFQSDSLWIARRLGISETEAKNAIKRLIRLNLLEENHGVYKAVHESRTTTDGIPCTSLKKSHLQNLELAKISLLEDPIYTRYFKAKTLTINPDKYSEAIEMLNSALEQIKDKLGEGEQTEVYKICTQFFPLTKTYH